MSENSERSSSAEWDFVTYDLDTTCSECGQPIRPGQAVGYVGRRTIHAKCFKEDQHRSTA